VGSFCPFCGRCDCLDTHIVFGAPHSDVDMGIGEFSHSASLCLYPDPEHSDIVKKEPIQSTTDNSGAAPLRV